MNNLAKDRNGFTVRQLSVHEVLLDCLNIGIKQKRKEGANYKMKDEVLNGFVKKILTESVSEQKFEEHIDMFSRFLGYVNPDYKYNGTYLSQYVADFISVNGWIKRKNQKYAEIVMRILDLGYDFSLLLDQVYYAHSLPKSDNEIYYIGINKDKIVNKKIEVKVTILLDGIEYAFCKEYGDYAKEGLAETICNDIEDYIELKSGKEI